MTDFTPYHEPWTESAVCRTTGGDSFYPDKEASHADWDYLRAICRTRCPVLPDCRDWVMHTERGQDHKTRLGVAAGMSPLERKTYEPGWLANQEESSAA